LQQLGDAVFTEYWRNNKKHNNPLPSFDS